MQILGILFQTIPRKRTQLGIPFRAKKIEINSRNAVPNHSVEEKPTQNKTQQPNISIILSERATFDVQTNHFVKLFCCCFCQINFFRGVSFHSVPSFRIGSSAELEMPQNKCFLLRNRNQIPFPTILFTQETLDTPTAFCPGPNHSSSLFTPLPRSANSPGPFLKGVVSRDGYCFESIKLQLVHFVCALMASIRPALTYPPTPHTL
jgi:hypothetical protein